MSCKVREEKKVFRFLPTLKSLPILIFFRSLVLLLNAIDPFAGIMNRQMLFSLSPLPFSHLTASLLSDSFSCSSSRPIFSPTAAATIGKRHGRQLIRCDEFCQTACLFSQSEKEGPSRGHIHVSPFYGQRERERERSLPRFQSLPPFSSCRCPHECPHQNRTVGRAAAQLLCHTHSSGSRRKWGGGLASFSTSLSV